jgi:hypothetical protein
MSNDLQVPAFEQEAPAAKRGVPNWMPFAGLVLVFAFAVYVGTQVFPTLLALLFPPEPPIPPGNVTLLERKTNAPGADEWFYGTDIPACSVYQNFEDRLGGCFIDPASGCDPKIPSMRVETVSYNVGKCYKVQTIGAYSVKWSITINTNYREPGTNTRFRIYREVTNYLEK